MIRLARGLSVGELSVGEQSMGTVEESRPAPAMQHEESRPAPAMQPHITVPYNSTQGLAGF
jgi:hypothetical protein